MVEQEKSKKEGYTEVKKDYFHEVTKKVKKLQKELKEGRLIKPHTLAAPPVRSLLKV